MHSLASFDRWFVQAARRPASAPQAAAAAPAPLSCCYLIGPQRDSAVRVDRGSAADILRAAHRIAAEDWCGLLGDDAGSRGCRQVWRLALWRAQAADTAPLWLSEAVVARPGQRPGELLEAVQRAALQALWAQGWRLVEAAETTGGIRA